MRKLTDALLCYRLSFDRDRCDIASGVFRVRLLCSGGVCLSRLFLRCRFRLGRRVLVRFLGGLLDGWFGLVGA